MSVFWDLIERVRRKNKQFRPTKVIFGHKTHSNVLQIQHLLNKTTEAQEWLQKKIFPIVKSIPIILNIHIVHLCGYIIENHYVARFVNPLTNPLCSFFFSLSIVSRKSLEKDFYLYIDPFCYVSRICVEFLWFSFLAMVLFCYWFFSWIHNVFVLLVVLLKC